MKIILIRHAKVNIHMPKRCNAKEFDEARAAYDAAPIVPVANPLPAALYPRERFRFYASALTRTHATLHGLFGDVPYTETSLLNEVPNRSFHDGMLRLRYPVWQALGRLEWLFNTSRQPEGRTATKRRALKLIRLLEKKEEDCVLISHEFYLLNLIRALKQCGYQINRRGLRIKNLEQIEAVKTA